MLPGFENIPKIKGSAVSYSLMFKNLVVDFQFPSKCINLKPFLMEANLDRSRLRHKNMELQDSAGNMHTFHLLFLAVQGSKSVK